MKKSVNVLCKKCKNLIVVDDESLFGEDVICPHCNTEIYIPLPESEAIELSSQTGQDTKRCPYCSEIIQAKAIKCKHCGEMLDGQRKKAKLDTNIIGVIGMLIPACSATLGYYWVSNMRLIDRPADKVMMISIATIVLTSLLFAIEASLSGMGSTENDGKRHSGPVSWFFFCVLLWIVGFPSYLYWRSRYGLKNMVFGGILIALIFLGTMGFLSVQIENAKENVRQQLEDIKNNISP
jgi:hypothetical protein